jgi:hypothetical protein
MVKHHRATGSSSVRTVAILIAVISGLYLAREILIPPAFAITLALILTPPVSWLQKIRLRRIPAVALVTLVAIAAAGGIGLVIFDQLVGVANELPRYQQNIHQKLEAMRTPGKGALGRATASVKELGKELAGPQAPAGTPAPSERTSRRTTQNQSGRPAIPPSRFRWTLRCNTPWSLCNPWRAIVSSSRPYHRIPWPVP